MPRKLDRRELVLRLYPPGVQASARNDETQVHVFRHGLASGSVIPACKQGEWLLHKGLGYWEYPAYGWILKAAPMCPTCRKRLVSEGIIKE